MKIILVMVSLFASVYGTNPPPTIGPNSAAVAWNAETPTPGNGTTAASQQFILLAGNNKSGMPFSVDGKFSGAPGAFEVDVQVAATDVDTNYQTVSNGNITTVDATNNTFHLDATLVTARFVRLLMRSRTNAVSITATITGG
jgi:hypothetical protein